MVFTGELAYPDDLETVGSSLAEIRAFGRECRELRVDYVGLCCGNSARYTRALAESLGHRCPAAKYQTDLSKSVFVQEQKHFD